MHYSYLNILLYVNPKLTRDCIRPHCIIQPPLWQLNVFRVKLLQKTEIEHFICLSMN